MPILPLDHPEPFAATLGVMFYPGTDGTDPRKARAFAAQWLAKPLRRFHEAGHSLPYDTLARIAMDAGEPLDDLDKRWWGGTATGELFKTLLALAMTKPALATWNNAARIAEIVATRAKTSGSHTAQGDARRRFVTVAHLWGAWSIREGKFGEGTEAGKDGYDDFQSFLAEAESLRQWGQTWQPRRSKSEPPLPPDVWRVPESWTPPVPRPGWPERVILPDLRLTEDLLAALKPPGRPRKAG